MQRLKWKTTNRLLIKLLSKTTINWLRQWLIKKPWLKKLNNRSSVKVILNSWETRTNYKRTIWRQGERKHRPQSGQWEMGISSNLQTCRKLMLSTIWLMHNFRRKLVAHRGIRLLKCKKTTKWNKRCLCKISIWELLKLMILRPSF